MNDVELDFIVPYGLLREEPLRTALDGDGVLDYSEDAWNCLGDWTLCEVVLGHELLEAAPDAVTALRTALREVLRAFKREEHADAVRVNKVVRVEHLGDAVSFKFLLKKEQ